ncbi:mitochondrial DNA helicase (Pif1) [Purpureocillium lavendulum]|uniref:ATP-dependent DNA helicase PIF1 n=1 Tax=Purpureocillium lavendulum TaxID=1247861 RepID=A0AB34G0U3_9HYPO|nr:mitochondrial DNA helicase (Pif1) [Purpureocillium lavendulum]
MPQMPHPQMPLQQHQMPPQQMPPQQMPQPQMPPQQRQPPMMNGLQGFPQPMNGPQMQPPQANAHGRVAVQQPPPERRARHSVEVSDLRLKNTTEADARQLLSSIIVVRHEKWFSPNELDDEGYPIEPSWARVTRTEEADISSQEANRKVRELAKEGPVADKKAELGTLIQQQLEETQANLEKTDPDRRYRYILTQLDWKTRKVDESTSYHKAEKKSKGKKDSKDGKDGKKGKKPKEYKIEMAKSSKSKSKSKTRKERVSVTAYFKRTPIDSENALKMLDEIRKSKKPKEQAQQHGPQHGQQQAQQQRVAAQQANFGHLMGQGMPHFPPQVHHHQQAQQHPQAMPQMPPVQQMNPQPRPQQAPMGGGPFQMPHPPMGGQPVGAQPMGAHAMGGQPAAARQGHIGGHGQGHPGRAANIEVVPPAGKGFKLYFGGSPRDSRSSFTSDDGWESEGSEYMTPESSIGSSSRRSHRGRYRSRSRHRPRERPEAFGLEVPRRHSKRDVDYIPAGISSREPTSPGPKALAPAVDVDRLLEQAYRDGREDEAIRESLRPKVIQAPPVFRRITDHEARREVFADELDRMGDNLYRTRLDDELRHDREVRRQQDARYERQLDDMERDRRMQDRMGRALLQRSPSAKRASLQEPPFMTAGITSLPIRSSPTSRTALRRAGPFTYAHAWPVHPQRLAGTMFRRAVNGSAPPPRGALERQLFPSSSPSAPNGDIRQQFGKAGSPNASASARTSQSLPNPLDNRSANAPPMKRGATTSSLISLCGKSDSFTEADVVDLTGSDVQHKGQEMVQFDSDDFSDDADLDLDYEAPKALPPLPSRPVVRDAMPPPPTPSQPETPIPWSSSPASHMQPAFPQRSWSDGSAATQSSLKRESSGDNDFPEAPVQKKAKKRVLPASFGVRKEDPDVGEDLVSLAAPRTPASKSRDFLDPTASVLAEQKKQHKNQRNQRLVEQDDMQDQDLHAAPVPPPKPAPISLSSEQRHVLDLVVNKGTSVFFTGPAGAGKSVLMRAIIQELRDKYKRDPERVAVTASTGLAACNIGGMTLHSFSGIGLGKEDASTLIKKIRRNPKAKNRWLRTKCLVIDEVSMVDGDLFDKLSQIGRTIRNNGRPWGGIQLVITGDFFQLPPVPDYDKKREVKFAFDAATWSTSIDHTIGLTQVFRQRDPVFARMLNEMRLGKITPETVNAFKALDRPLKFDDGVDSAELYPTRAQVDSSNEKRLRDLPGESHRYEAMDTGDPKVRDKLLANMMSPKSLDLKKDAQVMLIKNMDETLVNGSLGKVIGFSDEKTFEMSSGYESGDDGAMAKAKRKLSAFSRTEESSPHKYPVVQFVTSTGVPRVILCQPEDWKVELPNGEIQAKRTQLPLILAWALSIHKAQGQTLERVTVNLGKVFEKGQAYVALSRATTQQGLRVIGFDRSKVMAHDRVVEFYGKLYSAEQANGLSRPNNIMDFVANRKGEQAARLAPTARVVSTARAAPAKKIVDVIDIDDDEEAMASYGY